MFNIRGAACSASGHVTAFSLVLAFVALAACAATPRVPADAFSAADAAIAQADQERVADYASAELVAARDKIASARQMAEKSTRDRSTKEMLSARRLAEESRSDAELATAKAHAAKAALVNKDMQQNINTLHQEIQRNNGS
jgi:hypothetical protein